MEGGGSSGAGPASSPGASPWCHKPLRPLPLPCRWDPGGCDLRPTGEEGLHLRPDAAARGPDGEPGPSAWSPSPGPLPLRTCVCTLSSCGRSPVRALVSGNPAPFQPRSASPSWMHTAPCTRHTPPAHSSPLFLTLPWLRVPWGHPFPAPPPQALAHSLGSRCSCHPASPGSIDLAFTMPVPLPFDRTCP